MSREQFSTINEVQLIEILFPREIQVDFFWGNDARLYFAQLHARLFMQTFSLSGCAEDGETDGSGVIVNDSVWSEVPSSTDYYSDDSSFSRRWGTSQASHNDESFTAGAPKDLDR